MELKFLWGRGRVEGSRQTDVWCQGVINPIKKLCRVMRTQMRVWWRVPLWCSGKTFQKSWPLVRSMKDVREWAIWILWAGCSRQREEGAPEALGIILVQLCGAQVLLMTLHSYWEASFSVTGTPLGTQWWPERRDSGATQSACGELIQQQDKIFCSNTSSSSHMLGPFCPCHCSAENPLTCFCG